MCEAVLALQLQASSLAVKSYSRIISSLQYFRETVRSNMGVQAVRITTGSFAMGYGSIIAMEQKLSNDVQTPQSRV